MKKTNRQKNNIATTPDGLILVLTGYSGSGKDSVVNKLLSHSDFVQKYNPQRLVTFTDRPARPGEINGVDYHFVTPKKMEEMAANNEFIEPLVRYGASRKATPRKPFMDVVKSSKTVIWRIDPHRAAEVATGHFYRKVFDVNQAVQLSIRTHVVCLTVSTAALKKRIIDRDKTTFNEEEFNLRLERDREMISEHAHRYHHIIENKDGLLRETIEEIVLNINQKITSN